MILSVGGHDVRVIVDGVTKAQEGQVQVPRRAIGGKSSQDTHGHVSRYPCNFGQTSRSQRIIRTLKHLRKDKQERISRETMEIYAPLAPSSRDFQCQVGVGGFVFQVFRPETEFYKISHMMKESVASRQWKKLSMGETYAGERHFAWKSLWSPKHIYSILSQDALQDKETFDEIYDLIAIRCILDHPNVSSVPC